ncbi:MAG: EamA family transporter [Patescibacteria group bacterium]
MNLHWLVQSFIALFSAAGMMILILTQTKVGVSVNFIMMIIAAVWLPSFVLLTYKEGISFEITITNILIIFAAGVLSVLANYMQFNAANNAPNAGIVYAILGCSSVLVTVFSWIFYGGRLTLIEILGIILCVFGTTLLNLKTFILE